MSTVVNDKVFLDAFATLGWGNPNDLLAKIASAGLPAAVILAYLNALIATPSGLNDQNIAGVSAAQGTAITNFLKTAGLVVT